MLAEPIVDAGHGVAFADEPDGGTIIFVALFPRPAVDPDDDGQRRWWRGGLLAATARDRGDQDGN